MSETIKLGLLGNNIGRSRAKHLHELLGEMYGIPVSYEPMDLVQRGAHVSLVEELERCRAQGFRGVNVTHPYKREAFEAVTPAPELPQGLTAVNTVLFADREMIGYNTDYSGLCRAFRSNFGEQYTPGRVLMLGTGGVGVAIAYGLQNLGADELIVADTDTALAQSLVRQMSHGPLPVRLAGPELHQEMEKVDGLINATPIGMFQYPGCAFPQEAILSQRWAFDAVYTPENTQFLAACRARGIQTLSGFALFLYQGLDAFERFCGIQPDAHRVEQLFLARFPLK